MKRKAESPELSSKKAPKLDDYCNTQPNRDDHGNIVWPAQARQIVAAQEFLRECASSQKPTLIVPDKDADGLSAGVIVHRTLMKMGLDSKYLDVHLVQKGSNIHEDNERKAMQEKKPSYVIVLDQGSRGGPPVIDNPDVRSIIIDHHLSDEFPKDAQVVSACHCPPVATTSLLIYEICKELDPDIASECGYLCAIGTHGDLGNTLKWLPPFPDMAETFKRHTKKLINDCVSFINAPRRTGTYDVITAWTALLEAKDPKQIMNNRRLAEAREEINIEVEKQTHTPPKFSKDGKIAVLKINSKAQVHPVIATRWASHLKSKALEIVMVANYGYLPGKVNFSCRIARCARGRDPPINIIESLKAVADLDTTDLVQRLGESFARGHKEASGGIVNTAEFEELCGLMKVGEKPDKVEGEGVGAKKKVETSPQKNTLNNYFKKS
ncbi:DHH family protein-like protein [Mollisia scopiformis]|uniref:DHH family protein-like protein n=1 Tax=Mollisia scopiformis TaxID=149040 RepID=A0A194X3S3_MOLSC|nr:DHH family protein-like protein [Mollisia scopiformis]KUJ14689.1 DHH family protein-like protein [Mollisia scopiformis]